MQPSASAAVVGPTPEELVLISFAKSTINLIASWEALRLAIAHGWGSSESRACPEFDCAQRLPSHLL